MKIFQRALVSVSSKDNLDKFLKPFYDQGMEIVSTGGTARFLESKGFKVTYVEDVTGFPEALGGRVKTLHPHIHAGLLAHPEKDKKFLEEKNIKIFDLVVVNLYPFEKVFNETSDKKTLIENIDVGGPTMLRAASKNYVHVTVVCEPKDYDSIQAIPSLEERQKLASKVFQTLTHYDSLISKFLSTSSNSSESSPLENITYRPSYKKVRDLRYGENPHQESSWFEDTNKALGLQKATLLGGKPLSYNNLIDLHASVKTLKEFSQSPACVIVKHGNPCGVACGENLTQALERAFQADPVSCFGGVVALNGTLSSLEAEVLSQSFLECVIACEVKSDAFEILNKKKNLRVLQWPDLMKLENQIYETRSILGGILVQQESPLIEFNDSFELVGNWEKDPSVLTDELKKDLLMALKVVSHLKSNAICLVQKEQTLGLGMGQVNRVDAVKQALERKESFHKNVKGNIVLASDGFFPFTDSLKEALWHNVQFIIQPGGSIKDEEVKSFIREHKMSMILTKTRYFEH